MRKTNNAEIRQEIERRRLNYYEVADALDIDNTAFSRMLRKELTEEQKSRVLTAIKSID